MVKNGKHCLVAVDLGNSFGAPFEVAFGLVGGQFCFGGVFLS